MRGSTTPASLAEGRWLWRRLYVFAVTAGLWALVALSVERAETRDLPRLAEAMMRLIGLILVLYLVAPSAQQMIVLLAQLKPGPGGRR